MAKSFQDKQAIGLAGEYVVGAVVVRRLQWPYRMQPIIDLGIDGEIEVLNADGSSTGRLLKVQSKAVRSAGADGIPSTVYIDQRNFDYWTNLALPVIVVRPVLASTRVFWKPASSGRATVEGVAYDFTQEDELTESSGEKLAELAVEREQQVDPLLGLLRKLMHGLAVLDYTPPDEFNLGLDQHMQTWAATRRRWEFVQQLEAELPALVTDRVRKEMATLKDAIEYLDRRINVAMRQWDP